MPYKIYNQAVRDKKKRKKRQGMQVDNHSIFTIVATMVHKAKKRAKKSEKQ